MSPADRAGLHPLVIPLARRPKQQSPRMLEWGDGVNAAAARNELTCLLRWPEGHAGMELPVVAMSRGDKQV